MRHYLLIVQTAQPTLYTHLVPRSETSIRNPLQAVKRRSCGVANTRATRSAKRDLYTHATTDKSGCISPASRNIRTIILHSYPQLRRFAACSGLRIKVPLRGTHCFHLQIFVYGLSCFMKDVWRGIAKGVWLHFTFLQDNCPGLGDCLWVGSGCPDLLQCASHMSHKKNHSIPA